MAAQHRAFYAENRDITDAAVLAELAETAGVDRDAFLAAFPTRKMIYLTGTDFFRSQSMSVTGFPTVVLRSEGNLSLLTAGFQPFAVLKPQLENWIAGGVDAEKEPAKA